LKLFQEWVGGRKAVERVNSSIIYLIHCKNFCKCHNVPPPSTTIKKRQILCFCNYFTTIKNNFID
jgi:hypothetical protein